MSARLLALTLTGCALFRAPKPEPVEVAIVSMPQTPNNIGWACLLEPRPQPPKEQTVNYDDDDALRRVWVHMRAFNEMVRYVHDLDFWAGTVNTCLAELTRIHMVSP